ncbi:MAG: hypothetical protein V7K84_25930, partial [Nostoc sp.]
SKLRKPIAGITTCTRSYIHLYYMQIVGATAYLRLDCDASRPRLRAVYERFGFRHHSDKQVGAYFVSRYEYKISPQAIF